ncbi:MAG: DUF6596 domain-containing protein [Gemmatimonadota bacterium]
MIPEQGDRQAHHAADAVARRSYGKLVALLVARGHDLPAAEDALADAFAAALVDWPQHGVPNNPEAWLLTVARRKAIDAVRREQTGTLASPQLLLLTEELLQHQDAQEIPDCRLALLFAAAHPAIEPGIRAPLMLQVVLGLEARTIASAFLTSPAAMAKRLVRAKEKLRHAGIPFAIPEREELPARLESVLDAIYAAFSEGWGDPEGSDPVRRDLMDEALFLARIVTDLLPDEPEALGLLALLLHVDARRLARRDGVGDFVPLAAQDATRWNLVLMREAEATLRHAASCGNTGRYQLEAALQSAHATRRIARVDNRIEALQLYDALFALHPSPVVAINRALAVAEVDGGEAGLSAMPDASSDRRLAEYQPYWATRAELLGRIGRVERAATAYDNAIGLAHDPAVRRYLLRRKAELLRGGDLDGEQPSAGEHRHD